MNNNYRISMYVGTSLCIPLIMLFNGQFVLAAVISVIVVALIKFDSDYKAFRQNVVGGDLFIILTISVGGCFAVLSNVWPQVKNVFVLLFWSFFILYGMVIGGRVDEMTKDGKDISLKK